jgi:ferric-dicitrate binding protein FerR (iron transport regulator)
VEDRVWTLLARHCTGEATPAEEQELEALLAQDPVLKNTAQQIIASWHLPEHSDTAKAVQAFSRLDARIHQSAGVPVVPIPPRHFFRRYSLFSGLAASVILLVCGWFFFIAPKPHVPASLPQQEIATLPGSIRKLKLPDGSLVWLNEGSKMAYNDEFNTNLREVWLTGEAYFDVAKNPQKPFLIHARTVNVKVLGTAFNVKAIPGQQTVETSLVRGSVEITIDGKPDKKYLLKPNQKLVVPLEEKENKTIAADIKYYPLNKIPDGHTDSLIAEVSWVDHKLAFYESSFRDLAVELEKRYHVTFVFKNKAAGELVFTGVFYEQNLQQALHALSLTAPFKYTVSDGTVIISN